MIGTALRRTGSGFNPLTAIAWEAAGWASDPAWTNPGNGNAVSSWRNGGSRAGAGDFAQATGNRQPLFRSSVAGLNGQPALDFDGVNDYIQTANFSSALTTAATMVVIGKRNGATNIANGRLADTSEAATYTTLIANQISTGRIGAYASGYFSGTGPTQDTAAHLFRLYVNGASSVLAVDTTTVSGTLSTSNCAYLGTGGRKSLDDANLDSSIAFVGLYAGDITANSQWAAFKSWVLSTYGISA